MRNCHCLAQCLLAQKAVSINPFTPKSDEFQQFPLKSHQKYNSTQYAEPREITYCNSPNHLHRIIVGDDCIMQRRIRTNLKRSNRQLGIQIEVKNKSRLNQMARQLKTVQFSAPTFHRDNLLPSFRSKKEWYIMLGVIQGENALFVVLDMKATIALLGLLLLVQQESQVLAGPGVCPQGCSCTRCPDGWSALNGTAMNCSLQGLEGLQKTARVDDICIL